MKKTILSAVVLCGLSFTGYAQSTSLQTSTDSGVSSEMAILQDLNTGELFTAPDNGNLMEGQAVEYRLRTVDGGGIKVPQTFTVALPENADQNAFEAISMAVVRKKASHITFGGGSTN
jgi:hypothetical protein